MKKRDYESVIIFNSSLEDEQIDAAIGRVKSALENNGATITDIEKWGRKRLAYSIQKSKSGYYLIIRFIAPPDSISKLERFFFLEDTIIRYLTSLLTKKDIEYYKKKKKEDAAKKMQQEISSNESVDKNASTNKDSEK